MAQRVLVTAGASGIGKEIAQAFAASGATVCVCDINAAALDQAATYRGLLPAISKSISPPVRAAIFSRDPDLVPVFGLGREDTFVPCV